MCPVENFLSSSSRRLTVKFCVFLPLISHLSLNFWFYKLFSLALLTLLWRHLTVVGFSFAVLTLLVRQLKIFQALFWCRVCMGVLYTNTCISRLYRKMSVWCRRELAVVSEEDVCLFFKRECHGIVNKWTDEQILWLDLLERHWQYLGLI